MEKIVCLNCGSENPDNNRYCFSCGFELPKLPAPVIESVPVLPDTFANRVNKRKGLYGALFGIILFVLFIFLVKAFFFDSSVFEKLKTSTVDKAMAAIAEESNKRCPIVLDQYTRLINVKALPGRVLKYDYTLAVNKSDVDASAFKKKVESGIIEGIRNSPEMQFLRDNKATFMYSYMDKNGETMMEISVTPAMYQE